MRARCRMASSVMLMTDRVILDVPNGLSSVAPWAMGSMRHRPMECSRYSACHEPPARVRTTRLSAVSRCTTVGTRSVSPGIFSDSATTSPALISLRASSHSAAAAVAGYAEMTG